MSRLATDQKGEDQSARQAVNRLFDDTRRRLVETGTRNRLVHVNRANTRGNLLNIINVRSDEVHTLLAAGKTMHFLAQGRDTGLSRPRATFDSRPGLMDLITDLCQNLHLTAASDSQGQTS